MTLLAWQVFEIVVTGIAWVGLALLMAAAAAIAAQRLNLLSSRKRRTATIAGLLAGAVTAATSQRLGLESLIGFAVGQRAFPTLWVLAGAVAAVLVVATLSRERSAADPSLGGARS